MKILPILAYFCGIQGKSDEDFEYFRYDNDNSLKICHEMCFSNEKPTKPTWTAFFGIEPRLYQGFTLFVYIK